METIGIAAIQGGGANGAAPPGLGMPQAGNGSFAEFMLAFLPMPVITTTSIAAEVKTAGMSTAEIKDGKAVLAENMPPLQLFSGAQTDNAICADDAPVKGDAGEDFKKKTAETTDESGQVLFVPAPILWVPAEAKLQAIAETPTISPTQNKGGIPGQGAMPVIVGPVMPQKNDAPQINDATPIAALKTESPASEKTQAKAESVQGKSIDEIPGKMAVNIQDIVQDNVPDKIPEQTAEKIMDHTREKSKDVIVDKIVDKAKKTKENDSAAEQGVLKPTDQLPAKAQGKNAEKIPEKVSAQEVHRKLPEIVAQMARNNHRTGSQDVVIRLEPAELGKMLVRVTTHEGAVSVKITADLPQTCTLVENGLSTLRDSLQEQGIKCGSLNVELSGQSFQQYRENQSNPFYESARHYEFLREERSMTAPELGANTGAADIRRGGVDYVV